MSKTKKMDVLSKAVTFYQHRDEDFISLTDIARYRDAQRGDYIIQNWMRNRNTIEFLGIWEQLNNPDFNSIEFDGIRKQAGLNSFSLTPKRWTSTTGAIGIITKAGRYGGTFAHKDIAFDVAETASLGYGVYIEIG
ncbi:KilA-N domain-containing protein [Desulfobacterales bacterium HSG2]|nr:KilA-N domain-containing protein [Desulfobacterales bacterium HSG2]